MLKHLVKMSLSGMKVQHSGVQEILQVHEL